jgi:hypothetical protein
MKRILALDGGGIRGVFSLEILLHIQTLLREHYQAPEMVLADHFDLFAGTSTGAIIATCLCSLPCPGISRIKNIWYLAMMPSRSPNFYNGSSPRTARGRPRHCWIALT